MIDPMLDALTGVADWSVSFLAALAITLGALKISRRLSGRSRSPRVDG
ncbi:MAG: hypothetical protein JWM05_1452 [Acidimicrobiales bacterium]|nr:hypothetical protein [Acidimicrobiales bacterium]